MGKKLTQEEFLARSREVHGDRYDYSLAVYEGLDKEVIFICRKHGAYRQRARAHFDGQNCPECKVITTEIWIERAKKVHTDGRYSYEKSVYKGWNIPLIITCKYHGDFEMIPHAHISKECGCSECLKYTPEEWIEEARKVHGDKYDYTETIYVGAREKVVIRCPKHGSFEQVADSHLSGCGCSQCATNGYKVNEPAEFYVYKFLNFYGFGISNDFKSRDIKHKRTFKNAGVDATLINRYNGSGDVVLAAESSIKRTFNIVDTGLEGFRTEAVLCEDGPKLFEYLKNRLSR